jgi:hypothetical protein
MKDKHFTISMWKSGFRIGACINTIMLLLLHEVAMAIFVFAFLFLIAEILGILEEMKLY